MPLSPCLCRRAPQAAADLPLLVRALHECLFKLKESARTPFPDMYSNLEYAQEGQLAELDWFQETFPKDLTIAQALHTFKLFSLGL